jgi:cell division protein YceG involved in septum cleavage
VVSVYHNDENQVSTYYQDRLTEDMSPDEIWETLGEGKAYIKDWPEGTTREEIIKDALNWLVLPEPESWELDETIWSKFELSW